MSHPRCMATFFNPLSIREVIWDPYPALFHSIFNYKLEIGDSTDKTSHKRFVPKRAHQAIYNMYTLIDYHIMLAIMSLNQHSLNILQH